MVLYLVAAVVLYRYSVLYPAVSAVAIQIQRDRDREVYRAVSGQKLYTLLYRGEAGTPYPVDGRGALLVPPWPW